MKDSTSERKHAIKTVIIKSLCIIHINKGTLDVDEENG